ncbi:hypothetical protein PV721_04750 [Streptomyces sp. MB09-01]|uniref:hypothetical protein n=1 Tax=Streptomyces sp. MB09-01 TaxID=3028666 RepID=UPI0029AA706D|nr:hypothetical protein [Streptomyces sp. MB09-01]MDX3533684.1 hypothetical protein [Streptomyces sp. MB09-01]
MNPSTYAALYGPGRPTRAVPEERPVVAVLAALLWTVTSLSLAWLAGLFALAVVWGAAAGAPVGGLVLRVALITVGAAAALTALAFAPGIRRLAVAGRLLLLGALACPVPTALAVRSWFHTG